MTPAALLIALSIFSVGAFWVGKSRSLALVGGSRGVRHLHSLPGHYGLMTALWCALPALLVIGVWLVFQDAIILRLITDHLPAGVRDLPANDLSLVMNDVRNLVAGNVPASSVSPAVQAASAEYVQLRGISRMALTVLVMVMSVAAVIVIRSRITTELRARNTVERVIEWLLIGCSTIAVFTTIGIVASVAFEAFRFFSIISPFDFLFGTAWSPQMAIRADQVGSSGSFGAVPLFAGTALISLIAMVIAVPIGLFSAIYLAEYAHPRFRTFAKPLLEVLAGVPTVVYGFFAALTIGPALRGWGESLGLNVASESALAAGFVMGIMIIPFVSSLADDMISAVPQSLRDGAYALGATRSETIKQVVMRAALPGIVGGVLLAVSRAIGETMIVVMAAGLAANLTANPLEAVTTVTVQIVTLLVGDQEFDSPKTLAAFALGLVLFLVTLALNVLALHIVRKYREQYE
ncbi:MAG TPA: phosphate ABC transporter permease subunit PstC [Steroidobacteraceae bacterium]|jgi:phosphate transport system permease protein|nr:phosphate ABC transporter permease subunit PstC [Steroidobacteraceae bacterium]